MKSRLLQLSALSLALAACVLIGAGCGAKRSRVSGTVKYKGAVVPGGNIYLYSDSGSISSPIQMDGAYSMTDVPPGTYSVIIETETVNPDKNSGAATSGGKAEEKKRESKSAKLDQEYAEKMGKGGPGGGKPVEGGGGFAPASHDELLKRYLKIPVKYGNKTTSGLTFEVTTGEMKKDYDLTD